MSTIAERLRTGRIDSLLERRYRVAQAHALAEKDSRHYAYLAGLRASRRDELAQELAEIDARLAALHEAAGEG